MNTMTTTHPAVVLDMSAMIESEISMGNRITVKTLSEKFGIKVPNVRSMLVAYYGNRIVFKRGRTGGIEIMPPI